MFVPVYPVSATAATLCHPVVNVLELETSILELFSSKREKTNLLSVPLNLIIIAESPDASAFPQTKQGVAEGRASSIQTDCTIVKVYSFALNVTGVFRYEDGSEILRMPSSNVPL